MQNFFHLISNYMEDFFNVFLSSKKKRYQYRIHQKILWQNDPAHKRIYTFCKMLLALHNTKIVTFYCKHDVIFFQFSSLLCLIDSSLAIFDGIWWCCWCSVCIFAKYFLLKLQINTQTHTSPWHPQKIHCNIWAQNIRPPVALVIYSRICIEKYILRVLFKVYNIV